MIQFQIFSKFALIADLQALVAVTHFIGNVYEQNKADDQNGYGNSQLCRRFANITKKCVTITAAFYGFLAVASNCFPILAYSLWGIMITPTQNAIPGLDKSDGTDFSVIAIFDASMVICACIIVSSFDGLCLLIFVNMPMVARVIANSVEELECILSANQLDIIDAKQNLIRLIEILGIYSK